MRRVVHLFALTSMMVGTSVAAAAPKADPAKTASPVDRQLVDSFARCLAEKHPKEAQQYALNQLPTWRRDSTDALSTLNDRRCIPPQANSQDVRALRKFPEDTLKPAVAGALVRQELRTFDAALITTAKPLPSATLADKLWIRPEECKNCGAERIKEIAHAREVTSNAMAPHVFAECVVRTDPAKAHELLMTEPASAGERSAFDALAPALSNCLARDLKFTALRGAMRDLIALNYYRLAHGPRIDAVAGARK
jgi:hypothetical protein